MIMVGAAVFVQAGGLADMMVPQTSGWSSWREIQEPQRGVGAAVEQGTTSVRSGPVLFFFFFC